MQAPSGWPFVVPTYVYPPPRIQPQLQQQQQQQPYQVIQPQQYQQSQQQQQLTMCNQPPPLSTYWYYHPTGAPYPIPASVPATTTHVSPWFGNTAHYLTNPPPQYYAMPPCYVPQPTYCQGSTPYYYYYYPPYQYHPCDTSRPGPY
ncbi:hypothetical protein GGS21DRAFT_505358 [Xylaria nigripes]|nr:hypothetical protein GGS21DRAFT_505358 [Xylaria nigripes]